LNTLRGLLLAVLGLCAMTCAGLVRAAETPVDGHAIERQMLVMLRSAPPHFRPDVDYAGGYDASIGRDARRRIAEALARQYGLKILDRWPMPSLGVDCFVMEATGSASLEPLVQQMSADTRVESIQSMNLFRVLAHNDPLYPLQPSAKLWHLDEIHKVTTGRQVHVAEVDTGVEVDHPDLAGQVAVTRNFVDARNDTAEVHGTAVAGIIAARADNGQGVAGIAPESRLMALRACWQAPGQSAAAVCNTFTLAKALQFAIDEKAEVINLSLGGPRDRLLERLLDVALVRGAAIVAAVDADVPDGGFPASHAGVLAVAGDDAHDVLPNSLLGPGRDIPTTIIGHKWGFVTGSSFAAAHITGLVALLRELAPNLPLQQLREALSPPARAGASADRRVVVDACAAVTRIGGTCACACAVAGVTTPPPPP
jgi:hypothetical protein